MTVYQNRADYVVPSCPYCGAPPQVTWVDIEAHGSRVGSVVTRLSCVVRGITWDPESDVAGIVDHTLI